MAWSWRANRCIMGRMAGLLQVKSRNSFSFCCCRKESKYQLAVVCSLSPESVNVSESVCRRVAHLLPRSRPRLQTFVLVKHAETADVKDETNLLRREKVEKIYTQYI